ncbi:hypothetical protein [Microcoleus sp. T3_D1]|uniref:hypothetical protein n=1 Tax=Microcoleus sp. T3_D1 TaxID=3055427 RepID=UPI002FD3FE9C
MNRLFGLFHKEWILLLWNRPKSLLLTPVPQRVNFLVEQASCLLRTMVQDVSIKWYSRARPVKNPAMPSSKRY